MDCILCTNKSQLAVAVHRLLWFSFPPLENLFSYFDCSQLLDEETVTEAVTRPRREQVLKSTDCNDTFYIPFPCTMGERDKPETMCVGDTELSFGQVQKNKRGSACSFIVCRMYRHFFHNIVTSTGGLRVIMASALGGYSILMIIIVVVGALTSAAGTLFYWKKSV